MTNFEKLLLKTGCPDLIYAFVNDYQGIATDEFFKELSFYQKVMDIKIKNALSLNRVSTELSDMKV